MPGAGRYYDRVGFALPGGSTIATGYFGPAAAVVCNAGATTPVVTSGAMVFNEDGFYLCIVLGMWSMGIPATPPTTATIVLSNSLTGATSNPAIPPSLFTASTTRGQPISIGVNIQAFAGQSATLTISLAPVGAGSSITWNAGPLSMFGLAIRQQD